MTVHRILLRHGPVGLPALSAAALPAGVKLDYAVDDIGTNGVMQLGFGDRAVRLIGSEDTFRPGRHHRDLARGATQRHRPVARLRSPLR